MKRIMLYLLGTVFGMFVGYVACTIVANLENFQFYTIRSFVTGKSSMPEIISHPADRWIGGAVIDLFLMCGGICGALVVRRLRTPKAPTQNNPAEHPKVPPYSP